METEPTEKLRLKLLAEEKKLRSKQPPHWAKSKYRKYALRPLKGMVITRPAEPLVRKKVKPLAKKKLRLVRKK
ncbi:MAG: hypothetical protein HY917_02300 [Candidatus Diapherotrites archaeon]|nr:hypothetical protein [Candidatus Diapherotrites archaeon]